MFNLFCSSKNFRKRTRSFWNYYPDKPRTAYTHESGIIADCIPRERIYRSIYGSESFDYKTKFINPLPGVDYDANNDVTRESEEIKIIVPLNYCTNFLMINTEIELILKWSPNCVLTSKAIRRGLPAGYAAAVLPLVPEINRPKGLEFNINDCKLYVPVVALQETYDNELLEGLRNGIRFDFEWRRYRTQIINQPAANNLNFLIDPTFDNVNGLFVLAFPNE